MACTIKQSYAETLDRLSIATLKLKHASKERLSDIQDQVNMLTEATSVLFNDGDIHDLYEELQDINAKLWCLEDDVRGDSKDFLTTAKEIFSYNDKRAAVKKKIDTLTNSALRDDKIRSQSGLKKPLFILGHLGVGDTLLLSAVVAHACQQRPHVMYAVKSQYKQTALSLFHSLDKLKLVLIDGDPFQRGKELTEYFTNQGYDVLSLGDHSSNQDWRRLDPHSWADALYAQAGLSAASRYSLFPGVYRPTARQVVMLINKLEEAGVTATDPNELPKYAFVHDDKSRGFNIQYASDPPCVRPGDVGTGGVDSNDLFDYCLLIALAQEVHVIDSAFAHLVDLLSLNENAFLHTYARTNNDLCSRVYDHSKLPWKFIETPKQAL